MPKLTARTVFAGIAIVSAAMSFSEIRLGASAAAAPQDQGLDSLQHLDVKLGLWNLTVHNSQILPRTNIDTPEVEKSLEKLSPADRKKAIAQSQASVDQMRELSAKGSDGKRPYCLTAADLQSNELLKLNPQSSSCKQTVAATAQKITVHYACPLQQATHVSEATNTVERIDSENFKVTMQTVQVGDQPSTTNSTLTAHWIREDCAAPKTAKQVENDKRIAEAPIATATERHGNDYQSAVMNKTDRLISAYAVDVRQFGDGSVRTHIYDSKTQMSAPLKPHVTQREGEPGIISGVLPEATIFADGTTWGGPKYLETMMQRRVTRLKTLKAIAASLCDAQSKGATSDQAAAALEAKKKSAPNLGAQMQNSVRDKAYDEMITFLRRPRAGGAKATVAQAIARARSYASPLADDPVKDANGKLYITRADTVIACGGGK